MKYDLVMISFLLQSKNILTRWILHQSDLIILATWHSFHCIYLFFFSFSTCLKFVTWIIYYHFMSQQQHTVKWFPTGKLTLCNVTDLVFVFLILVWHLGALSSYPSYIFACILTHMISFMWSFGYRFPLFIIRIQMALYFCRAWSWQMKLWIFWEEFSSHMTLIVYVWAISSSNFCSYFTYTFHM